jgi:hypothetical protein
VRLQELWRKLQQGTRVADLGPLPQYIELAVIGNMKYDTTYSHITYHKELAFLGEEYRNELKHQALYNSLDEYDKQHNKNGQITLDEFKDNFRAAREREASCSHDPRTVMFPFEYENPLPNIWHVAWRMSHGFFKHRKLLYTHEEPAELNTPENRYGKMSLKARRTSLHRRTHVLKRREPLRRTNLILFV